ncbi:MAG TPA: hypothetical protein PLU75_06075 [Oscillospiraceae bacterium]|nr:hypothetical protein [Oscillospiraceae bacterium]HRW57815.1 hypothetical protein [Oscillospiraceae bacterium]
MIWIRHTEYLRNRAVVREYPAPAYDRNHQRPKRKGKTTPEQEHWNDIYASWKLRAKIACNFDARKDLFVTLTHKPKTTEAEAKEALRKFLRIMRRRSRGFKYIAVTEKQGVWHHHLIMNHADDETVEEIWMELTGCSRICWSKLDDSEEYFDLAWYMITGEKPSRKDDPEPDEAENAKRPRKRGQRRWSCSKGLLEPVTTDEVFLRKMNRKPPKLFGDIGYKVILDETKVDRLGFEHRTVEYRWCGKGKPPVYRLIEKNKRQEKRDMHERIQTAEGDGGADPGGSC